MFAISLYDDDARDVVAKSDEKKELPPNTVMLKPESASVVFWLNVPPNKKELLLVL